MTKELEYIDLYDELEAADLPDESAVGGSASMTQHAPSKLEESDLTTLFAADGPIAAKLPDYELRPSQLAMAKAVKCALLSHEHALIEAPTGTGKSMAYLLPAILTGRTVVIATANKALQSQLFNQDIPFLRRVLDQHVSAVVVKGRSNFLCTYKWEREEPVQRQMAMYDRVNEQVAFLGKWQGTTATGDVDELPFVLTGDLRPRVVSFADDCLQRDCRHYSDNCWVNFMRDAAAEAQLIVTNHHLLLNALELGRGGERILPPASIYIIDEAHQLEQTATAVFETTVTDYTVEQLLTRHVLRDRLDEDEVDELRFQNTLAFQQVTHLSRDNSFRIESVLEEIQKLGHRLEEVGKRLEKESPYAQQGNEQGGEESEERRAYELTVETVNSTASKLLKVATDRFDDEFVRYAARVFDRRHITLEVHAAPINPADLLTRYLFHDEREPEYANRTVICTSATLATNGNFDHFKTRCGLHQVGEEHVLPAVFDYPHQALLYQPPLPAFNYRNPEAFYRAVAQELKRLLEVSRGRSLALFTSWSGLQRAKEHLQPEERKQGIWPIRAQGDAPRDALLSWFKETPYSVLLATRSFWEGVDIPGDDLSLVVLDKMPFPTPNDPLHHARMKAIDDAGESNFGRYMLPLMTLALKQGFGRLVRRSSDRGVVAILDERLSSKSYGRQARRDLPEARYTRLFGDVHRFYQRVLDSDAQFGLNVWMEKNEGEPSSSGNWHWQLWRLQDGKSDSGHGSATDAAGDLEAGSAAVLDGLRNLRARIEGAGRSSADFSVEVRCSPALVVDLEQEPNADWERERALWRALPLLAVVDDEG